ncbi:MAG: TIGR04282 family arsenosugar biosynthesis glycosyltransferase [Cyclobacteriaceae bacterium]
MDSYKTKDRLIIIFYRNPISGHVKTRLAAGIGNEMALEVHLKLAMRTMQVASDVSCDKVVYYDRKAIVGDYWDDRVFMKEVQHGADLGEKMTHAFNQMFEVGYKTILIIGTDCPEITTELLESAFKNLETHNAVIGPASDGGYYLLGLKARAPELFSGVDWGSAQVFDQTIQKLTLSELSFFPLRELHDIDRPEDLQYLK